MTETIDDGVVRNPLRRRRRVVRLHPASAQPILELMRYRLAPPLAFALALIAPVGSAFLSAIVRELSGGDVGFLPMFPAVLLVAWVGGLWPGVVATGMAVGLEAWIFLPPDGLAVSTSIDQWRVVLFAATGAVASGLIESLHRARQRIERARDAERRARRAEQALRTDLESIVAAIGDGIVVSDGQGMIRLVNEAAERILGTRVATARELIAVLSGSDDSQAAERVALGDLSGPVEVHLAKGSEWVDVAAFPIEVDSESEPGRVIVLRDVTEAHPRELLREAFLSLVSHELRTPITAIYGGVSVLGRTEGGVDAATRTEIVDDLRMETDRLARLVEDLLVLGRMEEGVDVGHEPALLQRAVPVEVTRARVTWPEVTLDVRCDPDLPPVIGDDTSITQVLRNLISNAAKYSPPGSQVEVLVEGGDGEVIVRVLDRGRGISAQEVPHIFEAFYRSAEAKRMASGAGVGLFVTRRLVEAMGGRIWAAPREGGGAEFGFALPWWPLDPDEADEQAGAPEETAAQRDQ